MVHQAALHRRRYSAQPMLVLDRNLYLVRILLLLLAVAPVRPPSVLVPRIRTNRRRRLLRLAQLKLQINPLKRPLLLRHRLLAACLVRLLVASLVAITRALLQPNPKPAQACSALLQPILLQLLPRGQLHPLFPVR